MKKELQALEYDKIRNALAEHAVSACGKELCMELEPYGTIAEAEKALEETDKAVVLFIKYGTVSFSDLTDITNSCRKAENGAILGIPELLKIARVLYISRKLHEYLENHEGSCCFSEYTEILRPNKYFEDKIYTAFPSEEEVADNASPALHDIRRKQLQTKNKIRSVLDSFLKSHQKYLQDNLITIRNDRYVLPVKQEYKQEVNGLVHDTSSSGATLFIEPMAVVSANNELSVLISDERREIDRILQEYSAEAGTFSENIIDNFKAARYFDFLFAKAKYSESLRATKPLLNEEKIVDIKQARHPLIPSDKIVPVDLPVGRNYSVLIVTGPNTGGKTVSLKTLGLMCLMAKSGLFIPAKEESRVAFFDNIFADIGDEQSIEQSLSTFSSHMSNIVDILGRVTENSLVLLDELGSGTDPAEGAALAISIIEHIQSLGAMLMTTTHYAELKLYAIQTPFVENASCEFDIVSLKPTYRLIIGIPGKSNAFAIASKLGIDDIIIESAKYHLNNETVRVDNVLADLEINRKQAEHSAAEAERKLIEAEQYLDKQKQEAEKIRASANQEIEKAKRKALEIVEETREESNRLIESLEELRREKDRDDFREKISQAKAQISNTEKKAEEKLSDIIKKDQKGPSRPLEAGDTVRIVSLNKTATVLSAPDSKGYVLLQAGIIKTKIKINDLELQDAPKIKSEYKAPATAFKANRATRSASSEIDIRGMTVYEAESTVDDFINSCYLAGLKIISIIHGKGTGALRTAIKAQLKSHALVESSRFGTYGEGEMGVTIVTLK